MSTIVVVSLIALSYYSFIFFCDRCYTLLIVFNNSWIDYLSKYRIIEQNLISRAELFLPETGCKEISAIVLESSILYTTIFNLIIFLFLFLCIMMIFGSRVSIGENLHINKEYECGIDILNQNFEQFSFFNYFKILFIFLIFEVEIIFLFIVLLSIFKLNLICIFLSTLLIGIFQISFFIETYGGTLTHKR